LGRRHKVIGALAVLLMLGVSIVSTACAGDDSTATTVGLAATGNTTTPTTLVAVDGSGDVNAEADALSTFKSKDPFVQQALPTTSTSVTIPPIDGSTTSTYYTTTSSYTTTTSHTTTTRASTTTTTTAHLHSLKVLSVATVSGAATVTFKVDSTVYKDKRAGDVVSSTWGQIKVVDVSVSGKVVTLLHGSETLTLSVGQQTYE
jgi:hypothetical protein